MRDYDECRSYVTHVLSEHRRLAELLRQARAEIQGKERADPRSSIVATLRLVRDELERHFAQEDAGGCLEEAVSRCPRLSSEAMRIQAEHPELLRQLDEIVSKAAESAGGAERRALIAKSFEAFCRRVHAHEVAENDLLRQGFGANVHDGDNEDSAMVLNF